MNAKRILNFLIILGMLLTSACSTAPKPTPISPPAATPIPASATAVPPTTAPRPTATPIPPTATPAGTLTVDQLKSQIEKAVQAKTKFGDFSGAVLVAKDGSILTSAGYGLADAEKNIPNTVKTKFRIGTITEQFTAMAILMLQQQGKLNVKDKICTYIPDCPAAWQEITLHQLLTHTSGIPDSFSESRLSTEMSKQPVTPDEFLQKIRDLPVQTMTSFQQVPSEANYNLLGYIIAKVSGMPWETFLQENIFKPLGMANTGYAQHLSEVPDLAQGYKMKNMLADEVDMSIPYAARGLYSTVEDLYLWDQALYTEKLVPKDVLDAMFRAYAFDQVNNEDAGYGWRIIILYNGNVDFRKSDYQAGGYASAFARYPEGKATVIVLSNNGNFDAFSITAELDRVLFPEVTHIPGNPEGRIDIGGKSLEIYCRGEGSPTVVFGNHHLLNFDSWEKVLAPVAKVTRACIVNNAGQGNSDPAPGPQSARDIANDLHLLLQKAGIPAPYVLEALGQLTPLVFANDYPDETAGLVLIMPASPGSDSELLAALPAQSAGEEQQLTDCRQYLLDAVNNPLTIDPIENDWGKSWEEVSSIKDLGDLPLTIISQGINLWPCYYGATEKEMEIGYATQKEYLKLTTNGKHIIARQSNWLIMIFQPDLIADAILEIVEAARK